MEEFGSRLVLLSSAVPEEPLPFPVIPIPFLIRDYATMFPNAGRAGGNVSPADMELLQADSVRGRNAYAPGEAIKGLFACRQFLTTLLDTLQPSYVLTWDPTSPLAIMLQAMAQQNGLPVQGIERGLLPETLMIESRGLQGYSDLRTHWLAQDMPALADPAVYERIQKYYVSRKPQKYVQPGLGGGADALRQALNLGVKQVIVFFGHYEAAGMAPRNSNRRRYHSPAFESTADALAAVGDILARNPKVAVVFKPHPLDSEPYPVAKIQGVHVVRDVNVHALIELADVVVTQFTTLQFEAALYEKPIVLLGHSAWWGRHATYEVDQLTGVSGALDAALNRRDCDARQANAHAFISWLMDQFLIGCTDQVPARRNLRDFARFIAGTSLDGRHLPSREERWERAAQALEVMKSGAVNTGIGAATNSAPFGRAETNTGQRRPAQPRLPDLSRTNRTVCRGTPCPTADCKRSPA